jgi:hypothetical protein
MAIFSIWNAIGAEGDHCGTFGNEGVGLHCQIDYPWIAGVPYQLRVWQISSSALGDWWEGSVTNELTGEETILGKLESPAQSGKIVTSVLFDEYYQAVSSCSALPDATVEFMNLKDNSGRSHAALNQHNEGRNCPSQVSLNFLQDGSVLIKTGGAILPR